MQSCFATEEKKSRSINLSQSLPASFSDPPPVAMSIHGRLSARRHVILPPLEVVGIEYLLLCEAKLATCCHVDMPVGKALFFFVCCGAP